METCFPSAFPPPDRPDAPPPSDQIILTGISAPCILGCHPAERNAPRPVIFHVALSVDTRPAAATDALPDTLNYELVESTLRTLAASSACNLLETLANRAAQALLDLSPSIRSVTLRADKPACLPHTRLASVLLTRSRSA
jgi:dihydroneopterin aldolase